MKASNASSAAALVSAIQISCNARLAFGCWLFGNLASTLAVLCTQQRCSRVFGQPRQRVLSAASSLFSRPRDHAASRSAAPGVSLRWFAYVARPAGFAGVQGRPPPCEDADAADGDRGALSPPAHHEARTWPQDLS